MKDFIKAIFGLLLVCIPMTVAGEHGRTVLKGIIGQHISIEHPANITAYSSDVWEEVFSLAITPRLDSKVRITANGVLGHDNVGAEIHLTIFRNDIELTPLGDSGFSYSRPAHHAVSPFYLDITDAPNTDTEIIYSLQWKSPPLHWEEFELTGTTYLGWNGHDSRVMIPTTMVLQEINEFVIRNHGRD